MMQGVVYKVLWVEDNEVIVKGAQLKAARQGIQLVHFTNWEQAESELDKKFNEYSAIILDAFCKMRQDGSEEGGFINKILPSLIGKFNYYRKYIPWYILSAGTMSGFGDVVDAAEYQRRSNIDEWGPTVFKKDKDGEDSNFNDLLRTIKEVAQQQVMNIVLFRHKEVFGFLGDDKLIDGRARKALLKMLSALYYPEENIHYEFAGNPLRKVLEYMFRSARKLGLLSEHCFTPDDHIVLLDASRFMAGLDVKYKRAKNDDSCVRWGKQGSENEGRGGDFIFPADVADIIKNILNYSSSDSHTEENEPYLIDEDTKEVFFGYVMQLCYVLRWYGMYSKDHSDVKVNQAMHTYCSSVKKGKVEKSTEPVVTPNFFSAKVSVDSVIGKEETVFQDKTYYFAGSCKLSPELKAQVKPWSKVRILEVEENNDKQCGRYPFIATKIETL